MTSRGGYVVEEEKSCGNDDHGTRGRGVWRKAARKKEGSSCGGRGQFQRDRRLQC